MTGITGFIDKLESWSSSQSEIQAVAIVGSWARNTARPDSDIDVIIITTTPQKFLHNGDWLTQFGHPESVTREDWGLVQSLRVFYSHSTEVEFAITTEHWLTAEEIDGASGQIIRAGMIVVFDPNRLLSKAIAMATASTV